MNKRLAYFPSGANAVPKVRENQYLCQGSMGKGASVFSSGHARTVYTSTQYRKINAMVREIIEKSFLPNNNPNSPRYPYDRELEHQYTVNEKVAGFKENGRKTTETVPRVTQSAEETVAKALAQMEGKELLVDRNGRVLNAKEIGKDFAECIDVIGKHLDIYVIFDKEQMKNSGMPVHPSVKGRLGGILDEGEIFCMATTKIPPMDVAEEIDQQRIKHFDSMLFVKDNGPIAEIPEKLLKYRDRTVRVLVSGRTGETRERATDIAREVNLFFEKNAGYESRVGRDVFNKVRRKKDNGSLWKALAYCIPIVAIIKASDWFLPLIMTSLDTVKTVVKVIAGVSDDIIAGVIPNLAHVLFMKGKPLLEKLKNIAPELRGAAQGIALAFVFSYAAALLSAPDRIRIIPPEFMHRTVSGGFFGQIGVPGTALGEMRWAWDSMIGTLGNGLKYAWDTGAWAVGGALKYACDSGLWLINSGCKLVVDIFGTTGGKVFAGFFFALACSAGTVACNIASFFKSLGIIRLYEKAKKLPNALTAKMRASLAFQDAITDVPFRIGNTLIGVPLQIAVAIAGALAGIGVFDNWAFVVSVGILETLSGIATAAVYEPLNRIKLNGILKNIRMPGSAD